MLASRTLSRTALRASRVRRIRLQRPSPSHARFESTSSTSTSTTSPPAQTGTSHTSSLLAGLAGGALVFLGGYSYYHISGASSVVSAAHSAKTRFESAFKKSTEQAPAPNEALAWLRQTATSYAAFVPGAKGYVDKAFDDLDKVQQKHGEETEKIVKDTYDQLKAVSKEGASFDSVSKAWDILQTQMKKIADLAGDAAGEVLDNHPQLKEQLGGNLEQLKSMGRQYGPEAQRQVDETWRQVQDIVKGGIGVGTVDQIRRLVQEKGEEVRKLGDEAWGRGMESVKPLLEKQPKLKELVEQNKDKLMQGDLGQLWAKVQEAAKSGNVDALEKFVEEQAGKAQKSTSSGADGGGVGGSIEEWMGRMPGGAEIMPKLAKLQELVQSRGEEAEKLVKDAFREIQGVLSDKVEEGQKLAEKAKEDVKKK